MRARVTWTFEVNVPDDKIPALVDQVLASGDADPEGDEGGVTLEDVANYLCQQWMAEGNEHVELEDDAVEIVQPRHA